MIDYLKNPTEEQERANKKALPAGLSFALLRASAGEKKKRASY